MANAREFGAKGDGITDDTLALQRAIDETGVLELGKGSYLVSAPLLLDTTQRGYVGVRGAQGTSRIVMTGRRSGSSAIIRARRIRRRFKSIPGSANGSR